MYCNIVTTRPFDRVFTYYSGKQKVQIGQVVFVPFGNKIEVGIVWETNIKKPDYNIKEIFKVIDDLLLNKKTIEFIKWIADYTLAPLGSVLKLFVINKDIVDYSFIDFEKIKLDVSNVKLNLEQKNAKKIISKHIKTSLKPIVLEGVTGSGKTEVYFDLIESQINRNRQVLIMVPEISLTPQLETRFINRFGIKVDIWHSKISKKKRQEIWHKSHEGLPMIIIGARSSLFLPLSKLGLIIVDEEHDSTYKQEENIRYQARDLAVVRSKIFNCNLILSSATPSLETINNISKKKYHHVFLSKQYSGIPLPKVELIDLTKNKLSKNQWLSNLMKNEIQKCLNRKEQVLVFLNRRGYSPLSLCNNCGYRFQCVQCSSWMVMHQKKHRLLCHHCGTIVYLKDKCPKCLKNNTIKYIGPGVERVAEELESYFPNNNISIMSSDLMNTPKKIKDFIDNFSNKKIDIIVATQIMAKGYDFPNLSFVGVVDADAGLFGGDMRAIEKTFNLLQQVSGRAGRSKQFGKAMVQTYYPNQEIIKAIEKRDRTNFVKQALDERAAFKIPPFGFITSIIISGPSKSNVEKYSLKLSQIKPTNNDLYILGPVEAPISLLRGQYRYRLLLKGNSRLKLNNFTKKMVSSVNIPSSIKVIIDVDPYSFM